MVFTGQALLTHQRSICTTSISPALRSSHRITTTVCTALRSGANNRIYCLAHYNFNIVQALKISPLPVCTDKALTPPV